MAHMTFFCFCFFFGGGAEPLGLNVYNVYIYIYIYTRTYTKIDTLCIYILWMVAKSISHPLIEKDPGMIRFPCKYQR